MTDGQRAFEAYSAATGGRTHDGREIPLWTDLGDGVRSAWEVAADAVLEPYRGQDCI